MVELPEAVAQLREWSAQLESTAGDLLRLSGEIQARLRSDPHWEEGDDGPGTHRSTE